MLRRLEKRVLVDLPTKEARQAMFKQFLPSSVIEEDNGLVLRSDLDYNRLGNVRVLDLFSPSWHIDLRFFFDFLRNSSVQTVIQVPIFDWFAKKLR